ncbi:hypothetical protein NL676_016189 [Syzygium grande]|nr:hypothetical protein NL676_016189 [Syzygium grande]
MEPRQGQAKETNVKAIRPPRLGWPNKEKARRKPEAPSLPNSSIFRAQAKPPITSSSSLLCSSGLLSL